MSFNEYNQAYNEAHQQKVKGEDSLKPLEKIDGFDVRPVRQAAPFCYFVRRKMSHMPRSGFRRIIVSETHTRFWCMA